MMTKSSDVLAPHAGVPPCERAGRRLPLLMNLPEESYSSVHPIHTSPVLLNIGNGEELNIRELALLVREEAGFGSELVFDTSRSDGMRRKLCDVGLFSSLDWKHAISLRYPLHLLNGAWQCCGL